jgi:hypothetical protein
MQNNKILPCPCCDSEIKGGVQLTGFGYVNKQFIECSACGLKMETTYSIGEPILQSQLKVITKELITKWNTRKSIGRIAESMKNELKLADIEKERCLKENPLQFDTAKGYATGISNALNIVCNDEKE